MSSAGATRQAPATGRAGMRGWMPVAAHAFVAGVTQLYWLTYSPIATDAGAHYGVSSSAITWLANVYPLLYFVLAIPIGRLLDRAPRSTLITGALLTGLGGLIRALFDSYGGALGGQIIISIAQPVLLNGLIVVARAHLPEEQRAAGIAAGSVGFFVGVLAGYTTPVLLVDGTDITSLLWVQAVIGVIGSLWMAWAVRGTVAHHLADNVGGKVLRRVLKDPGVRVLALLSFGGFGAFGALLTVLQPLLHPRGVSRDHADLLVDGMVLAGLIVAAALPAWAARRGDQPRLLATMLGLASVAIALVAFDVPLGVAAILLAVAGAMLVPALPILLDIADQRLPELSGTVSAVIWLAGNLGVGVLTGAAQALLSAPSAAFIVLALCGLITATYCARNLRTALPAAGA